jgi:hypothetical protein
MLYIHHDDHLAGIVRSMVPYIDARFANAGTKDDAWFHI